MSPLRGNAVRVIDAHHHFWQRGRRDLAWLTRDREPLAGTHGPAELAGELAAAGVEGTVLVQAANTAGETQRMLRSATSAGFVEGVVAWTPLHRPEETGSVLQRCRTHPKFRGFRHITERYGDLGWLLADAPVASLGRIADAGCTFDVVAVGAEQLRTVAALADRIPELDLVIDHLGRPPVPERGWEPWASLIAEAAARPRVHAKVSVGLDILDSGWQWSGADLRPYVEHALSCFGTQRLMAASNWPVSLMGGAYRQVWETAAELLGSLAPDGRRAVLGGTAARFYRLPGQRAAAPEPEQ